MAAPGGLTPNDIQHAYDQILEVVDSPHQVYLLVKALLSNRYCANTNNIQGFLSRMKDKAETAIEALEAEHPDPLPASAPPRRLKKKKRRPIPE